MKIILKILIFSLFLNSCNGQNKTAIIAKTKKEIKKANNDRQNIDFLSKYKDNYQLVINESDVLDHPFFNFLDCDKNIYFSVHFVPKNSSLMSFWEEQYFKKYKYEYDDMITENSNIKNILKNNFKEYNIISYQVENKFLDKKNGCTEEGINIKKGGIVDIYLFNQNTKEWNLLKKIKAEIEPAYVNNPFFIDLFPDLFSFKRNIKSNENKKKQDEPNDNNEVIKNETDKDIFIINKGWYYNCSDSNSLEFTNSEINAQIDSPICGYAIRTSILKIDTNIYEIRLNESPPILPIPNELHWKDYSKNEPIAKLKYENNIIEFTWSGFYNIKTKKKEYLKNPFTDKVETKPIILKECEPMKFDEKGQRIK